MNLFPQLLVSLVAWSLYLAACACPAVKVDEGGHACTAVRLGTLSGFATIFLGWVPPLTVPWSANLLLLAGWICLLCKRPRVAAGLGTAAALVGLTTWAFFFFWQELLLGYYLWQASLASFAVGAWVIRFWQPTLQPVAHPAVDERDAVAVAVASEV